MFDAVVRWRRGAAVGMISPRSRVKKDEDDIDFRTYKSSMNLGLPSPNLGGLSILCYPGLQLTPGQASPRGLSLAITSIARQIVKIKSLARPLPKPGNVSPEKPQNQKKHAPSHLHADKAIRYINPTLPLPPPRPSQASNTHPHTHTHTPHRSPSAPTGSPEARIEACTLPSLVSPSQRGE